MPVPVILGRSEGAKVYLRTQAQNYVNLADTDLFMFAGSSAADPIGIQRPQDSTHVVDSFGSHRCLTDHGMNTAYLTTNQAVVNSTQKSLPLSSSDCPLVIVFSALEEIAISAAKFYVYSGTDITPVSNLSFYAAEAAQSNNWTLCNGSGNALNLADHAADVEQAFNLAVSYLPQVAGTITGTIKLTFTYV